MAIIKDKKNNVFYINYKEKLPNGTWKNINIRNKDWKLSVGVRYMKSIQQDEIYKDKMKRGEKPSNECEYTLEQICDAFYRVCLSNGVDNETIYTYKLTFKNHLFPIVPSTVNVMEAFTVHNMDKFRCSLMDKGLKPKTINNKMVAVKNLIKFAKKRKFIDREMGDDALDLLEPLKNATRISEHNNFFTHGEEDLRRFVSSFDETDKEWRIPVLTLFYGAFRIGEWQAIERRDVDFENDTILINKQIDNHGHLKLHTKSGNDRVVRLPHKFMEELKTYIENQAINNDEAIFVGRNGAHVGRTSIRRIVDAHLKLANVEHITLHGLRHSFATRMFDKGYDIKEVQEHLGHSSMDTTMKFYIHYTNTKKDKDLDDLL